MRNEFMININTPLQISPLIMLRTIQESDYELNEDEIPNQSNVLPCEIYVTKERNKKVIFVSSNQQIEYERRKAKRTERRKHS